MSTIRTTVCTVLPLSFLLLLVPLVAPSTGLRPCRAEAAVAAIGPHAAPAVSCAVHELPRRELVRPDPDFGMRIEHLVALQHTLGDAIANGDVSGAEAAEAEARAALREALDATPDAAARALAIATTATATTADTATADAATADDRARRAVLAIVFDHAASRLGREDRHVLGRALLQAMAGHGPLVEFGCVRLRQTPLLALRDEPLLLAIAPSLPPTVTCSLLRGLWQDAVDGQDWTTTERADHARTMLQAAAAGVRAAALAVLLADPASRELALLHLLGDTAAATAGASAFAELPPEVALASLRRTKASASERLPAVAAVAARAPTVVVDAYWRTLAAGVEPAFRAELVQSLGVLQGEAAVFAGAVFDVAVAGDPDPGVRAAALIAASISTPARVPALAAAVRSGGSTPPALARALAAAAANLCAAGMTAAAAQLRADCSDIPGFEAAMPPPAPPSCSGPFALHQE